jgi:hypothetical protein
VTHAYMYRIKVISYDGFSWTALHAQRGWRPDPRRAGRLAVTFG